MFAIGVALAVAMPYIGAVAGLAPMAEATGAIAGGQILNMGLFFGAFGAASSVISPVVNSTADKIENFFSRRKTAKSIATVGVGGAAATLIDNPNAPIHDTSHDHVPHMPEKGGTHFQDALAT